MPCVTPISTEIPLRFRPWADPAARRHGRPRSRRPRPRRRTASTASPSRRSPPAPAWRSPPSTATSARSRRWWSPRPRGCFVELATPDTGDLRDDLRAIFDKSKGRRGRAPRPRRPAAAARRQRPRPRPARLPGGHARGATPPDPHRAAAGPAPRRDRPRPRPRPRPHAPARALHPAPDGRPRGDHAGVRRRGARPTWSRPCGPPPTASAPRPRRVRLPSPAASTRAADDRRDDPDQGEQQAGRAAEVVGEVEGVVEAPAPRRRWWRRGPRARRGRRCTPSRP